MARPRVPPRPAARGAIVFALLAGLALAAAPALAFETHYRIVDLGGVPGGSGAYGVSGNGSAVGFELLGPALPHAVLFQRGHVIDLGTLGGDASVANSVGSDGQVVGWARLADSTRHAFLWAHGAMQDLGTLGGHTSQAFAINDAGTVVGSSWNTGDVSEQPFVWTQAAGMQRLVLPGALSGQALDVNQSGTVVGYYIDGVETQPFRWTADSAVTLPSLGGPGAKAYGVSDDGLVVGYALTPGLQPYFHAVEWRNDVIRDLGALPGGHSVAYAANAAGEVVGFSYLLGGIVMVATAFDGESLYDLNLSLPDSSGWQLAMATAVTNDGVITGIGWLDGVQRAFALVPTRLQTPPWGLPTPLALRAYPLPMRGAGTIELVLPAAMHGRVWLLDVGGRHVAELAEGDYPAGHVRLDVPARVLGALEPGVYFARFEGERGSASQRVVVVR